MPGSTAPHLGNPSSTAAASTRSWLDPAFGPWGRAAQRPHPALSRALPQPPEELLPCARSCFTCVATGGRSARGGRGGRKCWAPSKLTIWLSTMRWGASHGTVSASQGYRRVTAVSGGSTEPYAIWCCVPTNAGLSPTSPGFGRLEEALASGRGC